MKRRARLMRWESAGFDVRVWLWLLLWLLAQVSETEGSVGGYV